MVRMDLLRCRQSEHTIMVKAAPRFATILCLCYVRLSACVSSGSAYRWLGNCEKMLASCLQGNSMEDTHVGNANWGQVLGHGAGVECGLLDVLGSKLSLADALLPDSNARWRRVTDMWEDDSSSQGPVTQRWLVYEGMRRRGAWCWCWRTIWVPFLHGSHSAGTVPGRGSRASECKCALPWRARLAQASMSKKFEMRMRRRHLQHRASSR
jgi:hypothetical protein